jgi:hypothetical protein
MLQEACCCLLAAVVQLNLFNLPHCKEIELSFIVVRAGTPLFVSSVFTWQEPAGSY